LNHHALVSASNRDFLYSHVTVNCIYEDFRVNANPGGAYVHPFDGFLHLLAGDDAAVVLSEDYVDGRPELGETGNALNADDQDDVAQALADDRDDDDLEAVRIAIEFEAKGAKAYAKLRDSVKGQKEKEFFSLLAQIENEHYLSLKDVEEFLTDPESYYRRREHHGLDGG
jgi:hypothetical protein